MSVHKWTLQRGLALLITLACSTGQAAERLETAGLAVYTETARDIYIAGLLLPPGSGLENIMLRPGPKAMEYRIAIRRISSRGFSGTLLLQAEFGSGERAPDAVINALNELKRVMKSSLVRGDRFVIALTEDDRSEFYLDGHKLLAVKDGSVFDFFLAGWVGPSSSALLRDKLLSGDLDAATKDRFDALAPDAARKKEVAQWTAPAAAEPAAEPEKLVAEIAPQPPAASEAVAVAGSEQPAAAASTDTKAPEIPAPVAVATAAKATAVAATDQKKATAAPAASAKPEPPAKKSAEAAAPQQLAVAATAATTPPGGEAPAGETDDREYQRELNEFVTTIMKKVFSEVKYPERAIKRQREGKVELLARLDADGSLIDVTLDSSSGHGMLDEAAAKAVRKAAPFPELTAAAREEFLADDGSGYVMPIPVTFKLYN